MNNSKRLTESQAKKLKMALGAAATVLSGMPQTRPAVKALTLIAIGANAAMQYLEGTSTTPENDTEIIDVKVINNDNKN